MSNLLEKMLSVDTNSPSAILGNERHTKLVNIINDFVAVVINCNNVISDCEEQFKKSSFKYAIDETNDFQTISTLGLSDKLKKTIAENSRILEREIENLVIGLELGRELSSDIIYSIGIGDIKKIYDKLYHYFTTIITKNLGGISYGDKVELNLINMFRTQYLVYADSFKLRKKPTLVVGMNSKVINTAYFSDEVSTHTHHTDYEYGFMTSLLNISNEEWLNIRNNVLAGEMRSSRFDIREFNDVVNTISFNKSGSSSIEFKSMELRDAFVKRFQLDYAGESQYSHNEGRFYSELKQLKQS